jgi:hypothetical protein
MRHVSTIIQAKGLASLNCAINPALVEQASPLTIHFRVSAIASIYVFRGLLRLLLEVYVVNSSRPPPNVH